MRNNKFTIDCPNCSTEITTVISSVGTRNSGISYSELTTSYHNSTNTNAGAGGGSLRGQPPPSKEDTIDEIKNMIQDHKNKIQKLKRSLDIVRNQIT